MEFRSIFGGAITVVFLLILQLVLYGAARKSAGELKTRSVTIWDLTITREDNRYSLSRLQMYLWTLFVVVAYVMAFLYAFEMPDIPENLYLLMGVNLAASVASTAIALRNQKLTREEKPKFIRDIFLEKKDSLDLPRTQMFVWTLVSLLVFVVLFARSFLDGKPTMPDVPFGLIVLMGISQGAYLGTKAAEKRE